MLVGVIADTHGYIDARMTAVLAGVDAIVVAGDIGGMHVLDALRAIAPVHAVYGNNDEKLGRLGLELREDFELGGVRFHLVHQLPHATPSAETDVVVFGHSHRGLVEQRDEVLYVNPGAAGRTGFHRLQTVALLEIARKRVQDARIIELGPRLVVEKSGRGAGRKVTR